MDHAMWKRLEFRDGIKSFGSTEVIVGRVSPAIYGVYPYVIADYY